MPMRVALDDWQVFNGPVEGPLKPMERAAAMVAQEPDLSDQDLADLLDQLVFLVAIWRSKPIFQDMVDSARLDDGFRMLNAEDFDTF